MTLIFLVESGGMLMVGIILNKVVSCFRKKEGSQSFQARTHGYSAQERGSVSDATAFKGKDWQECNHHEDVMYSSTCNTLCNRCRL